MRNDQRQFYVFDLKIDARSATASVPDMLTVLDVWQRQHAANATLPINRGRATVLIGDIQLNQANEYVTALVRLSDTQAPNSVYSDPAANTFREHQKQGNEGGDFGCHVMISLVPEGGVADTYTCAIERIPGLSFGLVQRLLSRLLRNEWTQDQSFFEYPFPGGGLDANGNPRMGRCCPLVRLGGRPSDTFVQDVENGHISGVDLVRTEAHTPLGGAPYLTRESSKLSLGIDQHQLPQGRLASILQAIQNLAAQFPRAELRYRVPGSSRTVTVSIDSVTGNPIEELYIKSFELNGINPFLANSSRTIVPHLIAAAEPEFLAERNP